MANAACHGAVLFPAGPFYDGFTPTVAEQIASLTQSQKLRGNTGLVSITAGAVDAGSLFVLDACINPGPVSCADAAAGVVAGLRAGALTAPLVATYVPLRAAAPNATIAVMGYPRLFDPANGDIRDPLSGAVVMTAQNQSLVNQAVDALNVAIAGAITASQTSAQFVDVTNRFVGHAVNSAEPWIVLNPFDPTQDANFHPNLAGHEAYAAALISKVKPAKLARK